MEKLKIQHIKSTGMYYFNLSGLTISFNDYKIFGTEDGLAIFLYYDGEPMGSIYKRSNELLFTNIYNQLATL